MLGALIKDPVFAAMQIGKIGINEFSTYVAADRRIAKDALCAMNAGKIKGKTVKVRRL